MPQFIRRVLERNGLGNLSELGTNAGTTLGLFRSIGESFVEFIEEFEKQGYVEVEVLLGKVSIPIRIHLPKDQDDERSSDCEKTVPTE